MPVIRNAAHLSRWERWGLVGLFFLFIPFGALVEMRSAFLSRRMGDLTCYLRGAWGVRAGEDIYGVMDNNGWHYNYPPLLAILMTPLADPPAGVDRTGMIPFAWSVGIWYVFSLACLLIAVLGLAGALAEVSGGVCPPGSRRWWALRLWPVLVCLVPIGHTLMRNQVNLLVLALLGGMIAAVLRRHSVLAGLCLSLAICIKIIPAFLLIYPLWRRDGRFLAACVMGLLVGLLAIPVGVLGWERTINGYHTLARAVLQPATVGGGEQSRAHELTDVPATGSQAVIAVLHNNLHPDPHTRPRQPAAWERAVHWLTIAVLTLFTLLRAGWRRSDDGLRESLLLGVLILLMLAASPVSHLHYYCLALPLIMTLLAGADRQQPLPRISAGLVVLLGIFGVGNVFPHLPPCQVLRDRGLVLLVTFFLGVVGFLKLGQSTAVVTTKEQPQPLPKAA